ncbi:MAG TPA: gamma carbonic anhydrase family protein [Dehalococcoidia bacterium]|nr:gamma carbonic anhydrase family protein [Dehalococcoidia bacterium]
MPEMIRLLIDKVPQIAESAFVSKDARVIGDVEIGENCLVMPGAVIRGDFGSIRIGKNVWIEDNAVLHSDHLGLDIGDNVTIGHGAVVNGRRVGDRVLISINASILHQAEIGDRCIIAAGAVVTEGMKIPSGSFVAGVPARVIGEASEELLQEWVGRNPQFLFQLAADYRKQGL